VPQAKPHRASENPSAVGETSGINLIPRIVILRLGEGSEPSPTAHIEMRRPSVIPARSKRESICSRHTRHLLSGIYLIVILSSSEGSVPSRTRAQERLPTPYTTVDIGQASYFPRCHPDPFDKAQDKGSSEGSEPSCTRASFTTTRSLTTPHLQVGYPG
jgi:hypothetical protein